MLKPKLIRKFESKISWLAKKPSRLRQSLLREGKTRWLDLGSSSFDENFHCLNLQPLSEIPEDLRERYFEADVLNMDEQQLQFIGQFDLVRLQHVFEHFSLEESQVVLQACARLLRPGGYLLINVPDLAVHIQSYFDGYRWMGPFVDFSRGRIPQGAPPSFLFAFHVHQGGYAPQMVPGDAHKWCYDYAGLKFQIDRSGLFEWVQQLGLLHPDANIPFTHNRAHEDLCVLARKAPVAV